MSPVASAEPTKGTTSRVPLDGRALEVTVLGAAPSAPQPDGQGSGLLVRQGGDALLLDCGLGVAPRLVRTMDPRALTAVIVTHLHADHFLDIVSLRYHLPWAGLPADRLAVWLPPGGTARLDALAAVISEPPDFFSRALDIQEYDPTGALRIGAMDITFVPSRHYVPAWGISVALGDGPRLLYSGDTGPSDAVVEAARGVHLLAIEATLCEVSDDIAERGHLTADEALAMARAAGVQRVLLTHLPTSRRAELRAATAAGRPRVHVARPGLRLIVRHD